MFILGILLFGILVWKLINFPFNKTIDDLGGYFPEYDDTYYTPVNFEYNGNGFDFNYVICSDYKVILRYFDSGRKFFGFDNGSIIPIKGESLKCTFNSCLGKWLCFDSNGHLYPCDRLCIDQYDLGDITLMTSIYEAFENENFLKILRSSILRRNNCIDKCDYYKNCYGGCNANAILNEINNNVSCYIQRGILEGIKKYVIELDNQKNMRI